jgi:hypothetical protein
MRIAYSQPKNNKPAANMENILPQHPKVIAKVRRVCFYTLKPSLSSFSIWFKGTHENADR